MSAQKCRWGMLLLLAGSLMAADRAIDPTFLHRYLPDVKEVAVDLSSPTCHYKPVFGEADKDAKIPRALARYGEVTVDPGGASAAVSYPAEEQVYVMLDGAGVVQYGEEQYPVKKNDFMYFPPGVKHAIANKSGASCRLIAMGFRIPKNMQVTIPAKFQVANIDEIKKQVVGNHPPTTLYQLMMGDTKSTRDRIAAGHVLTSLYIMEFAPGGTNHPHHHETEEEAYLVLDGKGEMVAGSGMDGIEARYPAKAGDAYFYRLNCTVGFYNSSDANAPKAHILAVRWRFPFPTRERQ